MVTIRRVALVLAVIGSLPGAARAQTPAIEAGPFVGYRFGGGFYELASGAPVDVDGAPSVGVFIDFRFRGDLQIEALFTHQEARFTLPSDAEALPTRWRVSVDHWQLGGLRELRSGPIRPFLTGTLGLTRYASQRDGEVRFSLAAGGGLKLVPQRHLAVRLDGRLYGTVVDAEADSLFCTPGACVGSLDAAVIWQLEFTAGVAVRF